MQTSQTGAQSPTPMVVYTTTIDDQQVRRVTMTLDADKRMAAKSTAQQSQAQQAYGFMPTIL